MKHQKHIQDALNDPSVTGWTKDIIKTGLEKDPVKAWKQVYLAEALLKMRCDETLKETKS